MSTNQQPPVPPYPGTQPPPAGKPKPARNTIGLVALVTAVLGFVFAVMEGAYILGWILLPIAFVLSLVALFQRDQPKKAALAALIITLIGTVAGGIAFMNSIGKAIDAATGGSPLTAAAPAPVQGGGQDSSQGGSSEAPAPAAPQSDQQGTRENPYPLGTAIANEDWQITVNSFTPNATKEVLAENQFNDKPDTGHQYALANVTVTRLGEEAASPMFEISVKYVTSQGNVTDTSDAIVVEPKPLSNNELYKGASTTGNVALQVPEGDDGLLRVTLGMFGREDVFVATR